MFGWLGANKKQKSIDELTAIVRSQLDPLMAGFRAMHGNIPEGIKRSNYVLGFINRLAITLYFIANDRKWGKPEEIGMVVLNALNSALEIDVEEVNRRIIDMVNKDDEYTQGDKDAADAFDRVHAGDVDALEPYLIKMAKYVERI
jgi:hypothetical protein